MKKKNSRRQGFTLIELLVVITIIGILAGIAFVGFGDVFGTAGRTAAQKNLKTVYESLAAKTRNFPTTDSVSSAEQFAAWFRTKTKDTRPELWFLPDDELVVELNEDGNDGVPSNIPSDGSEFTANQAAALGYAVAIPTSGEAKSRSFVTNLESGPFPILWTSGLEGERWSDSSPWAGEGGHVLFSDGTVRWFEETTNANGDGVFIKAVDKGEEKPESFENASSITDAVPSSWTIYDPRK
jgi:prepilin-type N-terminal cleavage/methylation domain-containing protein